MMHLCRGRQIRTYTAELEDGRTVTFDAALGPVSHHGVPIRYISGSVYAYAEEWDESAQAYVRIPDCPLPHGG